MGLSYKSTSGAGVAPKRGPEINRECALELCALYLLVNYWLAQATNSGHDSTPIVVRRHTTHTNR